MADGNSEALVANGPSGGPGRQRKGPETPDEALGQVAALMAASATHKHLALADIEWLVIPAILLRQFKLFHRDGIPVGFASWAFLTPEAEERFRSSTPRLAPKDWAGGENAWLIDLVSPFGGGEKMAQEIKSKVFPDRALKTLQGSIDGSGVKVVEV